MDSIDSDKPFEYWDTPEMREVIEKTREEIDADNDAKFKLLHMGQVKNHQDLKGLQDDLNGHMGQLKWLVGVGGTFVSLVLTYISIVLAG